MATMTVMIVLLLAWIAVGLVGVYYELRRRRESALVTPVAAPVTPPIAESPAPAPLSLVPEPQVRIRLVGTFGQTVHEFSMPARMRRQKVLHGGHAWGASHHQSDTGLWIYHVIDGERHPH